MVRFLRMSLVITFLTCGHPLSFSHAEIYEWRDAQGNPSFTDDPGSIPPFFRENAKERFLPERAVSAPTPQETPAMPREEEGALTSPDVYAECMAELDKDKGRLNKQLAEEQARLEEINERIHFTPWARFKSQLERERAELRNKIAEAQRIQSEVLPQREWECARKRVELR